MPTFNAEPFVAHAIESVLEQTRWDEAELIVVDDGSVDATVEIVQQYGPRLKLFCQPHRGTAAARNRALAEAQGDIVVLLDHDDELHPAFLERIAEPFHEPSVGLAFTDAYRYSEKTRRLDPWTLYEYYPLPDQLTLRTLIRMNFIFARAAIRTDLLRAIGGFDEDLSGVDDYDVWLRLVHSGTSIAYIPEPLVYYRMSFRNQSSNRLRMAELGEKTLSKALKMLDRDSALRRECQIALAAATERKCLLLGAAALADSDLRRALANFKQAFSSSPLRWRGVRVFYSIVAGLRAALRRDERAEADRGVMPMRHAEPPRAHLRQLTFVFLRARRRIGWNAGVARSRARGTGHLEFRDVVDG